MVAWLLIASLVTSSATHSAGATNPAETAPQTKAAVRRVPATVIPPNAPSTPYTIDPLPHLIAASSALLLTGFAEALVKPALLGGFNCETIGEGASVHCDPSNLWGVDRDVVQWQSKAWRKASDYTATGAMVLAAAGAGLDSYLSGSPTPAADAATDIILMAESISVATLLTHVLKFAIRRPRPTMYHPGTYSVENQLSFPSGHLAATAAATTSYALTFALRHPESPWRYAVLGGGTALTVVTGVGRVGGGMHFITDVLGGAILGGAVGFLLPYLNRTQAQVQMFVAPDEQGGERMQVGVEVPY